MISLLGEDAEPVSSVVVKDPEGGWVTTSVIDDFLLTSYDGTQVVIGCASYTKGIPDVVKNSINIKIVSKYFKISNKYSCNCFSNILRKFSEGI